MNRFYAFMCSSLLVISTYAIAEESDLLDAYLIDLPGSESSQTTHSDNFVGQPVEIMVDENGKRHEVVQKKTVEYRRIDTADGSELYEEVVIGEPSTIEGQVVNNSPDQTNVIVDKSPVQTQDEFEIIQLEPEESDFAVIEASDKTNRVAAKADSGSASQGHVFCQNNPYARECLLSKYLSLCKKDPQSTDCKSQLQKFDGFCETFPNAFKCKKAKIAASCKQSPNSQECLSFTQRYCQKYPKAIFCNYN